MPNPSPAPSPGATAPAEEPSLRVAEPADAEAIVEVIHAAFGARPPLDPPSTADAETAATVRAALGAGGGVVAEIGGRIAGVILVAEHAPGVAGWRRVSVHPDFWNHGIGSSLVAATEEYAAAQGCRSAELVARREIGSLLRFWQGRGYELVDRPDEAPHNLRLVKQLAVACWAPTVADMHALGGRLAGRLAAGDLVVASGALGAGKTTLTQGIGAGLGVGEAIISPTFVLSRVHPSLTGGPTLVHVDAYRLAGLAELEDLDLDTSLGEAVTVVEWGRGAAEGLVDSWLEVDILTAADDSRLVLVRGVGPRWADVDLTDLREAR
ncbi:tRNA (adenosine(37)-N6)-threonylcarbamoyltransferase complex ATPase subunit type 1 TsaE [Propionibacteriaceae bacterium Y2011]|uniref:tRNA (adenosine(37)-N6)-threonylcarbamoyltransferase complex ATPase subunit type 1 TsaE n=1 Tax=Microlunatus sp. Y2014 TaxID=3418488 RepID=UPI003B4A2D8C